MLKIKILILIFLLLGNTSIIAYGNNASLVHGVQDIFWSDEYQKKKGINAKDDSIASKNRLLTGVPVTAKQVGSIARINTIFNDNNVDFAFDSIPLEWNFAKRNDKSWLLVDNNRLISKASNIEKPQPASILLNQPKFDSKWASIRDYDKLYIDYRTNIVNQGCNIDAEINLVGKSWASGANSTLKKRWTGISNSGSALKTEKYFLDAEMGVWSQKDFSYLVSRKLGLKPDKAWRYTQDGKNIVIQRRMHWMTDKFSSLFVSHSKEMNIVGASISVSFESMFGSGELVVLNIPSGRVLSGGEFDTELDVGTAITNAFPELMHGSNSKKAYIQEIFLHVESDVKSFLLDRPLTSISLMGLSNGSERSVNNLMKTVGIYTSEFDFKEKGFDSFLNQFFGDMQDSNAWRWQEDNSNNTMIDKDLNWVFRPKSKLAVYVAPDTKVDSISVQFGTKESVGHEVTIYDPVLIKLPNSKSGVLLDLDSLVSDQLLGAMDDGMIVQPILKSIQVSIKGNAEKVVGERKLHELALFESEISASSSADLGFVVNTYYHDLNTHIEKIGTDRERKIFDLSKLTNKAREMVLEDGILSISVPPKQHSCQIEIDSISLVSNYKKKEKSYISKIKSLNKKYGGRFLLDVTQKNYVEGLKFLAYSSPALLYTDGDSHEKITNIPVNSVGDVLVDGITTTTNVVTMASHPSEGVNIAKDSWVSTDGLKLMADGQIVGVESSFLDDRLSEGRARKEVVSNEGNNQNSLQGVRIQGVSKNLTLSWPVKVEADRESFFFLSIPEGLDQIAKIKLKVVGAGGEHWSEIIKANQPISLVDAPDNIDTIIVKIDFLDQEFDIVFGDVSIAIPKIMKHDEALVEGTPWKGRQLLKQGELSKGITLLNNSLENNSNYWSKDAVNGAIEMNVLNPVQWFEGMGIEYQIPNEWLKSDGCIVEGEFVFDNKILRRSFCLGQSSGSQSFTVGELGMLGQENLEKIIWHIAKPKGGSGVVAFKTWVNARGLNSIYNQIKQSPILYLGGKPYYLDDDNLQDIANNNHGFWTNLPAEFLIDYLENTHLLTLNNENPWLEVERIAVEPKDNMSLKEWLAFIKPMEFERSFNWLKLIGYLLLFGGIAMAIRKGWWSSIQLGIVGLTKMIFWQLPKTIITQSWALGVYVSRWMNIILGVSIVPLLTWLAGNSKDIFVTTTLLFSAVLLSISVYRHYVQFGVWMTSGKINKIKWPELAWGLVIVSVMWLILLISANKIQWYMIMPLLSSFYGVLPEVTKIVRGACKSSKALFEIVLWGCISVVLYIIGLMNWSNAGENYYLTFGGMAVVLMWRALIAYIKPIINSKWPTIAEKIYEGAGAQYFSGFIVVIVGVTIMLLLNLELVAEQLAIIGYYMLVVGVVLEMLDLRKDKGESDKKDNLGT